jgi:hypothetical protein
MCACMYVCVSGAVATSVQGCMQGWFLINTSHTSSPGGKGVRKAWSTTGRHTIYLEGKMGGERRDVVSPSTEVR